MRKILPLVIGFMGIFAAACDEAPTSIDPDVATARHKTGNDFYSGGHDFRLNIIGVPRDKTADMDNNNGRRIFVQLESTTNTVDTPGGKNNHLAKGGGDDQNHIYLCNSTNDEGDSTDDRCMAYGNPDDFGVIDANATDGDGALLAVRDPCDGASSIDGCTPKYVILARALGPGGNATITTCATEDQAYDGSQDTWCGDNGVTMYGTRGGGGGKKATDITDSLLYMGITVSAGDDELQNCINGTVGIDYDETDYDVYLFDRCFEDYFWNCDNDGLKLLELRRPFLVRDVPWPTACSGRPRSSAPRARPCCPQDP